MPSSKLHENLDYSGFALTVEKICITEYCYERWEHGSGNVH